MTGFGFGISMAGLAADTSRAFIGSGVLAGVVANRIISKTPSVRFMFAFGSEGVNAGQLSRAAGINI
jgi:hypothetical protein